jgi:hypothetical protein
MCIDFGTASCNQQIRNLGSSCQLVMYSEPCATLLLNLYSMGCDVLAPYLKDCLRSSALVWCPGG